MKLPTHLDRKYVVSLTVAFGIFLAVYNATNVNVALSAMQETFGSDINTIQWVVSGYFLA